jgi:hypothetical protein
MDAVRFLRVLALTGALLSGTTLGLFGLVASNTYMGPTHPIPGNPQRIRVEIEIRDSSTASGPQIQKVIFNQEQIPLKPRDVNGSRGNASFLLAPGKYKLKWTVNRDNFIWPRSVDHEEEVLLSPRDLWIQISIEGNTASIH